jgi:transcriptional regulator with XRE-family HTH domain
MIASFKRWPGHGPAIDRGRRTPGTAQDAQNKGNIPIDKYHILLYSNYDLQYMRLGEKLRYLREIEGTLRGREGALTQAEVVRLLKKELRETISQAYLSQIESGARPHLTNSSRMLLAKFYKVHPGYLVDDPEGYQEELMSDLGALEDKLDLWLINGAERFRGDPEMSQALLRVARHDDSRMCVVLLGAILDNPGLAERLLQVLKPSPAAAGAEASPKLRRRSQ